MVLARVVIRSAVGQGIENKSETSFFPAGALQTQVLHNMDFQRQHLPSTVEILHRAA